MPEPRNKTKVRILIPPGATYPFRATFVPDWWQVNITAGVSQVLRVFERPQDVGSENYWPLTGTGQVGFSADVSLSNKVLNIVNPGGTAAEVVIYASTGYPPPVYAGPVSVAELPKAIPHTIRFDDPGTPGNPTPINFECPAAGSVLVGFANYRVGGSTQGTISIDGLSLTNLRTQGGLSLDYRLGWYGRLNVAAGFHSISIPWDVAPTRLIVFTLAFPTGIVFKDVVGSGFVFSDAWNDGATHEGGLIAHHVNSGVYCMVSSGNTTIQERYSSKALLQDIDTGGNIFGSLYQRLGTDNQPFALQNVTGAVGLSNMIELYPAGAV